MELSLFALYVTVFLALRTRLAFVALVCFSLMFFTFELTGFEHISINAINFCLFAVLTLARDKLVMVAAFLCVILQFIMAIDTYVLLHSADMNYNILYTEESITLMYSIYPYADFILNILLLLAIIKAGVAKNGADNSLDYDLPVDQPFLIHSKTNKSR